MSINRFLGSSRRGCLFPSPRKQEVLPPGDMPVPWPVQRQEWVGEKQASGGFTCPAWGSSGCLQGGVTLIFPFTLWLLILSLLAHRIFSTGLLPLGSGFLWSRPGSVYHQHGGPFRMHIRHAPDLASVLATAGSGSEILSTWFAFLVPVR